MILEGRWYLASPMSTYRTERYDAMVDLVRAKLGPVTEPLTKDMFVSNLQWLAALPEILSQVVGVAFFADGDGFLGMGVVKEVDAAVALGLPVFFLPNTSSEPVSRDRVSLVTYSDRPWSSCAMPLVITEGDDAGQEDVDLLTEAGVFWSVS